MSLVNCTTILLFLFIYNTATIIDSIGNIEMFKACFSLNNNFEEKTNHLLKFGNHSVKRCSQANKITDILFRQIMQNIFVAKAVFGDFKSIRTASPEVGHLKLYLQFFTAVLGPR